MLKREVLIATTNNGKFREIKTLLEAIPRFSETSFKCLKDYKSTEPPVENAETFEENALIKANFYFQSFQVPVIVDDSGFCVSKLKGLPGVHSAEWGKSGDFKHAINKIYELLNGEQSQAHFECVIVFKLNEKVLISKGVVKGKIAKNPRGNNGFGFDSCFIPKGETKTFAEMSESDKNLFSHRKNAIENLIKIIK
jgi:XTP/dITP diphosphohydrolase